MSGEADITLLPNPISKTQRARHEHVAPQANVHNPNQVENFRTSLTPSPREIEGAGFSVGDKPDKGLTERLRR